jgi:hypothetical protein
MYIYTYVYTYIHTYIHTDRQTDMHKYKIHSQKKARVLTRLRVKRNILKVALFIARRHTSVLNIKVKLSL